MPIDDYVQIMIESLSKKTELLDTLIRKNEAQNKCLSGKEYDDIDWDAFNLLVAEKEIAIERINKMDEGFQTLYDRVKEQLTENKDKYADSIREIQRLIGEITEQGVKIRTGEERNRKLIEKVLGNRKKVIRKMRNSLRAASSYAQTMSPNFGSELSSMDDKK